MLIILLICLNHNVIISVIKIYFRYVILYKKYTYIDAKHELNLMKIEFLRSAILFTLSCDLIFLFVRC